LAKQNIAIVSQPTGDRAAGNVPAAFVDSLLATGHRWLPASVQFV